MHVQLWPALKLQIGNLTTRQRTPKFDAIVDSGSPWCIFKTDFARFLGLDLSGAPTYPLGGVVGDARDEMAFYKVNLIIETNWCIQVLAGFAENLAVHGILGRHGFFENFTVHFDHSGRVPQLTIEKFNRA